MSDAPDPQKLKDLEGRIAAAQKANEPAPPPDRQHRQANAAWRMVIELVTGIVVGFGMGYGLDGLMGTGPIFMLIFLVLGFAAGIRVMMQTAQQAQDDALRYAEKEKETQQGSRTED